MSLEADLIAIDEFNYEEWTDEIGYDPVKFWSCQRADTVVECSQEDEVPF